jgi:RNA ligase
MLVEIIYPQNRVVVDYGHHEDLVLIAARSNRDGVYGSFVDLDFISHAVGFALPERFRFNDADAILKNCASLNANFEGYVVHFEDGSVFKFKGDKYKELHKLISGLSFKKTLAHITAGTMSGLRAVVPDEFMNEVNAWEAEIEEKTDAIVEEAHDVFGQAPRYSRKEFALWVNENHKSLASYLFALLDGKPIRNIVLSREFKDRGKNDKQT